MQLSQVPALFGSNWSELLLPALVGLCVTLRHAVRTGHPHWRSDWRWMFGCRRASALLLAFALVLFAGWAVFVQVVRI